MEESFTYYHSSCVCMSISWLYSNQVELTENKTYFQSAEAEEKLIESLQSKPPSVSVREQEVIEF